MVKNMIISILFLIILQPIWVPGTSILQKAYANTGFFVIEMIMTWKAEERIKSGPRESSLNKVH